MKSKSSFPTHLSSIFHADRLPVFFMFTAVGLALAILSGVNAWQWPLYVLSLALLPLLEIFVSGGNESKAGAKDDRALREDGPVGLPVKRPKQDEYSVLDSTLEAVADGILVVAPDGEILAFNNRFAEMWSLAPSELKRLSKDEFCRQIRDQIANGSDYAPHGESSLRSDTEQVVLTLTNGRIYERHSRIRVAKGITDGVVYSFRDATARKNAERTLQESEERFRAIVETTSNWIWEADVDGLCGYNNPAVEQIFGYTQKEMLGKSFLTFMHEEDREQIAQLYPSLVEQKSGWNNLVCRWRRKDGSVRYLESNAVPILDENGELVGFRGTDRDITDRRIAEEALRRSQNALDATRDGVFMFDPETLQFSYVNEGAVQQVGYSRDELLRMTPLDIKPEFTLESFQGVIAPLLSGETASHVFTTVHRHKDGTDIPVEIMLQRVSPGEGENLFVALVRDIRERKAAEERLRDSETRYRLLFESNPNPIWIYDLETLAILAVNEEAVRHYGYSREEFQQLTIRNLRPAEDIPLLDAVHESFVEGVGRLNSIRHKRKDGTIIEVDIALQDTIFEGRPARFALMTDVTERRRAERELLSSEKRFRSFMNNNPGVAFMKDEDGRYVFVNDTIEDLFQLSGNDFIGKTDFELMPRKTAVQLHGHDREVLEKDRTIQVNEAVPMPDGTVRSWLSVKFPVEDGSGNRYLGGVAIDVTERERMEKALRESEYKLRMLFDHMHEGLVQVSNLDLIEFVNDSFCLMTGYAREELIGRGSFDLVYDAEAADALRESKKNRLPANRLTMR